MGYHTSNAAYAYDMPASAPVSAPQGPARAPERQEQQRPRFSVLPGAAREADQAVSPIFTHVVKVCCVLIALAFIVGVARVGLATATAAELNANAEVSTELSEARDLSSDLEVQRSVWGADSRVRDIAEDSLGMVEPEDTITLDLSDAADATDTSDTDTEDTTTDTGSDSGSAAEGTAVDAD